MALEPLAAVADLTARGIDTSDEVKVNALLASASATIRDAAGCVISALTATVSIPGTVERWLEVPGWAVRSVASAEIDGVEVTDFRLVGGKLWRACGWQSDCGPSVVTMTYTQGLAEVPADLVDLCCSLVAAGLAAAENAYDPERSLAYERIDDHQVGYRQGDEEVVSPMLLPPRTRAWLASRFNTGVAVTGSY